jgi:hypothetical protein
LRTRRSNSNSTRRKRGGGGGGRSGAWPHLGAAYALADAVGLLPVAVAGLHRGGKEKRQAPEPRQQGTLRSGSTRHASFPFFPAPRGSSNGARAIGRGLHPRLAGGRRCLVFASAPSSVPRRRGSVLVASCGRGVCLRFRKTARGGSAKEKFEASASFYERRGKGIPGSA